MHTENDSYNLYMAMYIIRHLNLAKTTDKQTKNKANP